MDDFQPKSSSHSPVYSFVLTNWKIDSLAKADNDPNEAPNNSLVRWISIGQIHPNRKP